MDFENDIYSNSDVISTLDSILKHYGMPRRSGRYPWGSGKDPYQHSGDWISRVQQMRKEGFTYTDENGKTWTGDAAIYKSMGMNSTEFRTYYSIAKNERRADIVAKCKSLAEDGLTPTQIARELGIKNESTVRSYLNEDSEAKMRAARATADILKKSIDEKGIIDVGRGVELELGVSRQKLEQALVMLEAEGYPVYGFGVPQVTNPGKQTNWLVIAPPGTEYKDVYDFNNLNTIHDYISYDGGETYRKAFYYPESLDSKRLQIRYAEEGGIDKDGTIELRRGVKDIDLGGSVYSQVRIMVDDQYFLKGMAVYSDNMPPGVDVIFNTNKKSGLPMSEVLKKKNDDPTNPFKSAIKEHGGQMFYDDPNGKYTDPETGKKQSLSLINKRADEGDWELWSKSLPSQFLAKQNEGLIKQQLKLAIQDKKVEYDEIMSITNPTIKRIMLTKYSENCDKAAERLSAAALPGQKYQVILPLTTAKDHEVYAPNFKNGETVALVRFPHGGTFEIPILKVNNKIEEGNKVITKNAKDAVGINSKVAARLSGADFDGDTVLVIPLRNNKITSKSPLEGLKDFDSKEYKYDKMEVDKDGNERYYRNGRQFRVMKDTQKQMGVISNLITDMTIKGANDDELARAVRHSMVVIDAEKHKLDYKQSEKDNNIAGLKKTYQERVENGKHTTAASTLLSRAKGETHIVKSVGTPKINPETGELIYNRPEKTYIDKNGKTKVRLENSTQMRDTKDARTLSSGTPVEEIYASYANQLKSFANQARKETLVIKDIKYSPKANKEYKEEVNELDSKLKIALLNAPRERQANAMANSIVKAKKLDNPNMTKEELKKEKQKALTQSRLKVGAERKQFEITDKELEAIQSGAITGNKLKQIVNNCDLDKLKERVMPRTTNELSDAKKNKIKLMKSSGYTNEEIANSLSVSTSTIIKYLK